MTNTSFTEKPVVHLTYFKAKYWQHFHSVQNVDGKLDNTDIVSATYLRVSKGRWVPQAKGSNWAWQTIWHVDSGSLSHAGQYFLKRMLKGSNSALYQNCKFGNLTLKLLVNIFGHIKTSPETRLLNKIKGKQCW